jgi:hypothetical protein
MGTGESQNTAGSNGDASEGISRAAAAKFSAKWAGTVDEQQNSQAFWQDFFREVIGIKDLQEAGIEFEKKVVSSKKGTTTRIDVYWRETLLVEQKSAGKDLDAAEVQAREYVVSLPPAQRPPVIVVCDFVRLRIVDILLNKSHEFLLEALPDNLQHIEAIAKRDAVSATGVQVEADQKAAKLMANLYLQLEKYGYSGHEASVFMVRVLFCLFADDTRMWSGRLFQKLVEDTNPEGTDLGPRITNLFALLDTPKSDRKGPQDPFMVDFPHVNGGVFEERIEVINFNGPMREALIDCCNYDWSKINPTIFGALFQNIKTKDDRRALGEHYTTEANIEKAIRPLFLDELNEKLEKAWDSESKLKELQRELGTYKIFDPACGCGNFLITSYKRLRQLELDILVRLKQLQGTSGQTSLLDVKQDLFVNLEQLYGIEYVEWSSQIAKVAVYLADHQENLKLESVIGVASNRFPLTHSATITQGNALQISWDDVCPIGPNTMVVGNPPFLGSTWMSKDQKEDVSRVWAKAPGSGVIDYVANWYVLAARYMTETQGSCAFVSTNSITQGEQPAILWRELRKEKISINFAHRTFVWESDASGKAAVHCVIIGFSKQASRQPKRLWDYPNQQPNSVLHIAKTINGYLIDGPDVIVAGRRKPIQAFTQQMVNGSKPTDDGWLSKISPEEATRIRSEDAIAAKYLREIIGAQELINGNERYCLWLVDASPSDLQESSELQFRLAKVRDMRIASTDKATNKDASTPFLFQKIRQPSQDYMAIPSTSSEKREYVPIALMCKGVIVNNAVLTIPDSNLGTFSVLNSRIFNVWNSSVSGRLESRFRISAEITYNNFPFPESNELHLNSMEEAAELIIEARKKYPGESLASLYDPLSMPQILRSAHLKNDIAVAKAFGLKADCTDGQILTELFLRYAQLTGEGHPI